MSERHENPWIELLRSIKEWHEPGAARTRIATAIADVERCGMPPPKPEFRVGDVVRYTGSDPEMRDRCFVRGGTMTVSNARVVRVVFNDGTIEYMYEGNLKKVEDDK